MAVFMDVDRMPLLARNVPPAQNIKSSKLRLEAWLHGSCTHVPGLGQVTMTEMQCTNTNVGCKIVIIAHYHTKQYPPHTKVDTHHDAVGQEHHGKIFSTFLLHIWQ